MKPVTVGCPDTCSRYLWKLLRCERCHYSSSFGLSIPALDRVREHGLAGNIRLSFSALEIVQWGHDGNEFPTIADAVQRLRHSASINCFELFN